MKRLEHHFNAFLFVQPDLKYKAPDIALLLARIYAGVTIMRAGLDKIPVPDWMVDQVIRIGLPFPEFFAWIACFSEFIFGFLLAIGLLTRVSGLILGITMGMAAFGFHKVFPLVDMHIAQHFFWMFVIFATLGGGKFSLDALIRTEESDRNSKWMYALPPILLALLCTGFWLQFNEASTDSAENEPVISSINIPGSFNDWDPTANVMTPAADSIYTLDIYFDQPGRIGFKFTANKSWDINLGSAEPITPRFPISGRAVVDNGNSTQNIEAYIPNMGTYRFTFNQETYAYSLDSLSTVEPN